MKPSHEKHCSIRQNQTPQPSTLIRNDPRLTVTVSLAGALAKVQIDVGVGDVITPGTVEHTWKDLLNFPEARLLAYPPETVIAEKLHAAMELELNNSRMKDFYDIDWLSRNHQFDRNTLRSAILATFKRRGSPLPHEKPIALTDTFSGNASKVTQWNAFLRKNRLQANSLETVIQRLDQFLSPILFEENTQSFWTPETGWQNLK